MGERQGRHRALVILTVGVVPGEQHQSFRDSPDGLAFDGRARVGQPCTRGGPYFPWRMRRVARL